MPMFPNGPATIHYDVKGQGTPVLFLPGVTDSIDNHTGWLAHLAQDHLVIAADLPGTGRSGPQPRSYDLGNYHQDAAGFAALLRHLGVPSAHHLGFSDGGEHDLFPPDWFLATLTDWLARH